MPPAEANESPKYELPAPVNTDIDAGMASKEQLPKLVASPEAAKNPGSPKLAVPAIPTLNSNLPIPNVGAQQNSASAPLTTQAGNPAIADDNDLIEKEWVTKAKKIIEGTTEDPYKQSQEITLFKADYMKKRYNKVIKVVD